MDETETVYGGKYKQRKAKSRTGGKQRLAGMGIKAAPLKQTTFHRGKGPGITNHW